MLQYVRDTEFRPNLFLCVILLLLFFAVSAAAQETLVQSIVRHREFFLQLNGYSDSLLTDVEVIDNGKALGIMIISREGFEQHLVFDSNMNTIYAKARILNKAERQFLIDTGISMNEVKRLAAAAESRVVELRRIWQVQ